jgi:hypothetical protein
MTCTCGHDEALHSLVFGCEASVTIKEGGGVDFGCRCVQFTPNRKHMGGCRCPECDPDFNDPRNIDENDYPLSRGD